MNLNNPGQQDRVVAFIDIGTNSVRLMVVRINPNNSYTILTRQKQQVRLGEGEFEKEEILPEAMERTLVVCKKFTELARTFKAEEFVAVATSATREAQNQQDLLIQLRREAQLDVRVVSGREEARLIYLGVSSGIHLGGRSAVFIDIGGGSTEIAVGDERQYLVLESVKLGAIRLTNQFMDTKHPGLVTAVTYKKILQEARSVMAPAIDELKKQKIDCAIGSSGTIINLAEIANRALRQNIQPQGTELTYRDLKKLTRLFCSLTLEQRRKIPGINPERADIIIAGAAILDTFMKELRLDRITATGRGLQDGLLTDYLSRMDNFPLIGQLSTRERSVLQLGRSCGINEAHARTVTRLSLDLFDSAKDLGLHTLKDSDRELLQYATFLHDIGSFIAYTNHHAHSYYIISNAGLPGFGPNEVAIMANIARFHRKALPRKKNPDVSDMDSREWEVVRILSTFLRLAESLDRSHAAFIHGVRFTRVEKRKVYLSVNAHGDCQLEIWGVEAERKAFEKVFSKSLILEMGEIT
ncbi:MAG: Ppx/GppA family phosphatase [Methanoregula sp.]|nr:Ppx/GppA family phosphatase [Methanoregula sp.]